MAKQFAVYLLASRPNGALYIGVTSDLVKRTWEHKIGVVQGHASRYRIHRLVYFEIHEEALSAINREKQIKKWRRQWKVELIEAVNPNWRDLYGDIIQ